MGRVSVWLSFAGLRLWGGVNYLFTLITWLCTSLIVHWFTGFSNYFTIKVSHTVYRAVDSGFYWF